MGNIIKLASCCYKKLNFSNLEFPIMIDDINKFEKLNNISANILSYYVKEEKETKKEKLN